MFLNKDLKISFIPETRRRVREKLVEKGVIKSTLIFGSSIKEIRKREKQEIPIIVKECIKMISSKESWMKADGLYRTNGNMATIQSLRFDIEQSKMDNFNKTTNVHNCTGLLNLFFRELTVPLIYEAIMEDLLKINLNDNEGEKRSFITSIIKVLQRMDIASRSTLLHFLRHLSEVAKFSAHNKMTSSNLAMMVGPILSWPNSKAKTLRPDETQIIERQNYVFQFVIDNIESFDTEVPVV